MSKLDKVITIVKIAGVVCAYIYLSRKIGEDIGYWAFDQLQNLQENNHE